jgi:hypothetical protein
MQGGDRLRPLVNGTARSRRPFVCCQAGTSDPDSNASQVGQAVVLWLHPEYQCKKRRWSKDRGLFSGITGAHRGCERGHWGRGRFRGSRKHRILIRLSKAATLDPVSANRRRKQCDSFDNRGNNPRLLPSSDQFARSIRLFGAGAISVAHSEIVADWLGCSRSRAGKRNRSK